MLHRISRIMPLAGLLILGASTLGCVSQARFDASEAEVARVRADAAQRDQQIAWLRWGQVVLAGEIQSHGGPEHDAMVRKVAALEAANAALAARLERAEHARTSETPESWTLDASAVCAQVTAPRAVLHTLDEDVPYEEPSVGRRKKPSALPAVGSFPASRRLDTVVPYPVSKADPCVLPRSLDENVPYH